ncbi:MAG: sodium:proton antiporter NhaD [Bacteroidetes bacterium]|nr:sodium:proton antiporter NhaD [Bacteroidota bacterium]
MEIIIITMFILGYLAITLEHSTKIDKLVPALIMMVLCWATVSLGIDHFQHWYNPAEGLVDAFKLMTHDSKMELFEESMLHHFGKTAEILIFLMGAMAIVEMIDHFKGFETIKKLISTKSKRRLLWVVTILSFILSAIIDNLTTTIVMITVLRKLIEDKNTRMWYTGMVIIAANAGGAWTPIGDVTTTMLWMADKVTSLKLIEHVLLPSLANVLIPVAIASFLPVFKGDVAQVSSESVKAPHGRFMLILGLVLIVFVPIFKTITHLPPYAGMMLSLSIFALIGEIVSRKSIKLTNQVADPQHTLHEGPTMRALSKIEIPSILFFLGILMAVAAMESVGMIYFFGQSVSAAIPQDLFVTLLGISSAIIDNVPLVAAGIGMFQEATDMQIWHFIAYAAGTGGSILIIGSAAGVVAMGMEKIPFFWYLKNISLLALLGYLGGVGVMLLMK